MLGKRSLTFGAGGFGGGWLGGAGVVIGNGGSSQRVAFLKVSNEDLCANEPLVNGHFRVLLPKNHFDYQTAILITEQPF